MLFLKTNQLFTGVGVGVRAALVYNNFIYDTYQGYNWQFSLQKEMWVCGWSPLQGWWNGSTVTLAVESRSGAKNQQEWRPHKKKHSHKTMVHQHHHSTCSESETPALRVRTRLCKSRGGTNIGQFPVGGAYYICLLLILPNWIEVAHYRHVYLGKFEHVGRADLPLIADAAPCILRHCFRWDSVCFGGRWHVFLHRATRQSRLLH